MCKIKTQIMFLNSSLVINRSNKFNTKTKKYNKVGLAERKYPIMLRVDQRERNY